MAWEEQKFQLPMFRDFVPEKLRFWIILLFPIVFQMSDAVFMGLSTEIASDLSLLQEDILMCGYAGMIGVTMTFPLLFRIKFRFTTNQILLAVTLGMAAISTICLFIRFVPAMIALSFLFGMLKLIGSFECFSSVMLKVAPRYNFAPFLTMVFTVVFGSIELSGIISSHICDTMPWQYMNLLSISMLLILALIAKTCMKSVRFMPPQPLFGIGWIGLVLWGLMLLAFAFIFVYGDYLNWFTSIYVHIAIGIILITIGLNLYRMLHYRHPYLPFASFKYRNTINMLLLYLLGCVMLSSESVLQHIFTAEVLQFSSITTTYPRYFTLLGIGVGAIFSTLAIEHLGWGYKRLTFVTFLFLTFYEIIMFCGITRQTNIEFLYLPAFFYGIGHVMLFIVITTYMEGIVPFQHRFQVLSILGFVRIGCGSAFGAAIFGHLFKVEMNENIAQLGSQINFNAANQISFHNMAEIVGQQSVMLSLQHLFGLAVLIGIVAMTLVAMGNFRNSIKLTYPTLSKVYKILIHREIDKKR